MELQEVPLVHTTQIVGVRLVTLDPDPDSMDWASKDCLRRFDLPDMPYQEGIDIKKGEIVGVHFQLIPLQTCLFRIVSGSIRLVIVDIRRGRTAKPLIDTITLLGSDSMRRTAILVPSGCAYGIQGITDRSLVNRLADTPDDPETRAGINCKDEMFDGVWCTVHFASLADTKLPSFRDIPAFLLPAYVP